MSTKTLCALLFVALTSAAHADPCPPLRSAHETGDASEFFDWRIYRHNAEWVGVVPSAVDRLGVDAEDFARLDPAGLSAAGLADPDSRLRRITNAAMLLTDVLRGDESWASYLRREKLSGHGSIQHGRFWAHIPDTDCGDGGSLRGEADGFGNIWLSDAVIRSRSVVERASSIVHEGFHYMKGHEPDHDCPAHASCDLGWGHTPQSAQVRFMMEARRQNRRMPASSGGSPDVFLPSAEDVPEDLGQPQDVARARWAELRHQANAKLNLNFVFHPGFNVSDDGGLYGAVDTVSWDEAEACCESAFFPRPDEDPRAIVGVGLQVQNGGVVSIRVRRRRLAPSGPAETGEWLVKGRKAELAPDATVSLPAGYVATGLAASADDDHVTFLALRARYLSTSGQLYGERLFCAGDLSAAACRAGAANAQVDVSTEDGSRVMTGFGLQFAFTGGGTRESSWYNDWRVDQGLLEARLTGYAIKSEPLPWYSDYAGGQGGSPVAFGCPSSYVGVGIAAKAEAFRGSDAIGFMGLICAPRSSVANRMDPRQGRRQVQAGSYSDRATGTFYRARVWSESRWANSAPPNVSEFYCPAGQALRGVVAHGADVLRGLHTMGCVDLATGASSGHRLSVGERLDASSLQWVGCGGQRGAAATGIYLRSGWVQDGAALKCEI